MNERDETEPHDERRLKDESEGRNRKTKWQDETERSGRRK